MASARRTDRVDPRRDAVVAVLADGAELDQPQQRSDVAGRQPAYTVAKDLAGDFGVDAVAERCPPVCGQVPGAGHALRDHGGRLAGFLGLGVGRAQVQADVGSPPQPGCPSQVAGAVLRAAYLAGIPVWRAGARARPCDEDHLEVRRKRHRGTASGHRDRAVFQDSAQRRQRPASKLWSIVEGDGFTPAVRGGCRRSPVGSQPRARGHDARSADDSSEQERRLRFLHALYDHEQAGKEYAQADQVARDIGMDPENWPPIGRITQALAADYLITGRGVDQLNGLLIVGLTGEGRRLVESKLAGHEPPGGSPASVGNITIGGYGNQTVVNISQNSPGATYQVTQHGEITAFDKRRILAWAEDVEQRASSRGLRPEDLEDVLHEVAELRAEVEKDEPDVSRLRRLGQRALRILGTGAGSLASSGLVAVGRRFSASSGCDAGNPEAV